ncbi:ATP phosphoribosyltransferase regulatory subunit [Leptolyngbyaceae cyanobacterium CCMR0082]|uniref:ATP phosphoribosyltransferase regulatory subunit n=2 Tax=Adonisia turfae TaxID=2950184 RepID=A0A6M0SJD5_9CYAN|nr:ATP phosphoribosyltransferase regulatory subunit [Adonisia turfae]NEZ54816.1 ATP phosphoribosyltransferase regulatory subunit [Adonisia turfae CCMR0081]NEZ68051.1 ATP phosphoribosyltransferase regulatory subunit [Adonisia turfae CCMR0082]
MTYQPPTGGRDLFPVDVAQKRWIEDRIEAVFQRWSYQRIITSTVESMDTLMAGGAIQQSEVIELNSRGERLGLRPELTASIARAAVTRISNYPQRLYYHANVFRRSSTGSQGGQHEAYQAGVELLGASGSLADVEVLLIMADCLKALGLEHWHLLLSEASLTSSLLEPFPPGVRQQVKVAIANLDRVTLETLSLSNDLKALALNIMDLRGEPRSVLTKVSQLDLSAQQRQSVSSLKNLIDLLENTLENPPRLVLDLSLMQTFEYYTGVVFEAVVRTEHTCEVVGQGGRYDNLLSLFHPDHKSYPGVGFVLNGETLQQILQPHLPAVVAESEWLVVPINHSAAAAAITHAQTLRQTDTLTRVELSLDPSLPEDQLRQFATECKVANIAWVSAQGDVKVEKLTD